MKRKEVNLIKRISREIKQLNCYGIYAVSRVNGITKIRMKPRVFFEEFKTHGLLIKNDVCYPYVNIYDDDMQIIGVYETKMKWEVYKKMNEDFIQEELEKQVKR